LVFVQCNHATYAEPTEQQYCDKIFESLHSPGSASR
jgi:hypothetical protein